MGSIGTLGALDPAGAPVPSEAGNLTTPGPIDLQATLAALVQRGARGVAMEVSSHSLDQGRVDGLVFRAAIFTNLTRDHLDYHKTMEEYFRAKAKLLQFLAPDGLVVVNADDPAWKRLRRDHRRVEFGERGGEVQGATGHPRCGRARGSSWSHRWATPWCDSRCLGRFNVSNALAVAACAWGMGVPVETIARAAHERAPGARTHGADRHAAVRRVAGLRPHPRRARAGARGVAAAHARDG